VEQEEIETTNRVKVLEDYIYTLERENSLLTKEVLALRHKYEPTESSDYADPF
jgi:hypothetical protein